MTVVVDDPLIARMAISRTLPLHESSRRLRELYPECPRVYGVAVMGDLSRRRWWPLAQALTTDRLYAMFKVAAQETENRAAVAGGGAGWTGAFWAAVVPRNSAKAIEMSVRMARW